jgi:hypothetical protein
MVDSASTFTSYLSDALSTVRDVVTGTDAASLISKTNAGLFNSTPDYRFSYDVFPEDLGAEYMMHYMMIRLYTQGNNIQANYGGFNTGGFSQNNYNVALFMPTEAGGGIFPTFEDTHEYADISMTNVFANQIASAKAFQAAKGAAAATGRAINPGVQVLYKTTHLRTFDFAFLFAPRSEKESQSMESIIKKIRTYAAPKDEGLFYRSPAEVEIDMRFRDNVNTHLIKMKRQVITGVTVQYAPQGVYSTFTNGYPVTTLLSIRTREMEIIDRDDVEKGY